MSKYVSRRREAVVTPGHLAKVLGVRVEQVHEWERCGVLPGFCLTGQLRFRMRDVTNTLRRKPRSSRPRIKRHVSMVETEQVPRS